MQPLVSIGMPVFNCDKTLIPAVNSILNQTYSNWELFLIDDGSKDKTLEIANSFKDSRIKVIVDGLNKKLPSRLNQAIEMSQGKYFARMDGDDISYPERLQSQVEYLESRPDIDLLSTEVITIDSDSNPRGAFSPTETHDEICSSPRTGFSSTHPTWMGKMEWFRQYKYRPKAIRMEDQDLLLRSYRNSKFACLPEILFAYRVSSFSLKNSLLGRYNFSKALFEQAFVQKDYLLILGIVEQALKSSVDIFATATGLNYKLLKHRTGPVKIEVQQLDKWKNIWLDCNSGISSADFKFYTNTSKLSK